MNKSALTFNRILAALRKPTGRPLTNARTDKFFQVLTSSPEYKRLNTAAGLTENPNLNELVNQLHDSARRAQFPRPPFEDATTRVRPIVSFISDLLRKQPAGIPEIRMKGGKILQFPGGKL